MADDLLKELSAGAFSELFASSDKGTYAKDHPTLDLQVIKARTLADNMKQRFTLSDGHHVVQTVYTLVPGQDSALPAPASIVRIEDYEPFMMDQGRPVILFSKWALVKVAERKIGNPEALQKVADDSNDQKPNGDGNDRSNASVASSVPAPAPAKAQPRPASRPSTAKPNTNIIPIESLSPYSNHWTIRARVTSKGEIRRFQSKRGEGQLFNVNLVDESGEIRATGFGDTVDRFYNLLQEHKAYYISRCSVTLAKKQFSNLKGEYELRFEQETTIEECDDESTADLPSVLYNFVSLGDLGKVEANGFTDVIGVIKEIEGIQQITASKTGRVYDKRELKLVDSSKTIVPCTLWGQSAQAFTGSAGSVIAFKGVKVGDFGGRSLSVGSTTTFQLDPDIEVAHTLKGWYESQGKGEAFEKVAVDNANQSGKGEVITIAEAIAGNYGKTETTDYFSIRATVSFFSQKSNMTYPGCPNCRKKLQRDTTGQFRCEKDDMTVAEPNYQYTLAMSVADFTDKMWISAFSGPADVIMGGISAQEFSNLKENQEDQAQAALSKNLYREYIFRIRARQDTYNEKSSVRYGVVSASPVKYGAEIARLSDLLEKY